MKANLFIFLVLPAIAFGYENIMIQIEASDDRKNEDRVKLFGSDINIITDEERIQFGIEDDPLKDALKEYLHKMPDKVFVRSQTPDDLYAQYNWKEIRSIVAPKTARILMRNEETEKIYLQEFINRSSVNVTFNFKLSRTVENTVSIRESESSTHNYQLNLETNVKMPWQLAFVIKVVSLKVCMIHAPTVNSETTFAFTSTVSSSNAVKAEVQPGEGVIATLSVLKGSIKVEVEFEKKLDGDIACIFKETYNGTKNWQLDVNTVLNAANLTQKLNFKKIIKVEYYTKALVRIDDAMDHFR